ncbi:MAG: ABC transporter permease [Rhizobiaceae bacterium]
MTLQIASTFVSGITIAMTLFLNAAGLTLLFGVLRILNFAQGTFIMLGAYVAATFLAQAAFGPGYFLLIALVGGAAIGLLGLAIDFLVFRRLRHVDEAVALIATFALMIAVQGAVKLIFGSNFISISPPSSLDGAFFLGRLIVPQFSVFAIAVGVLTFIALEVLLTRMWLGKVVRSVASNAWIMSVFGYDTRKYVMLAVGLSFFLAGFAGAVLVPNQTLQPTLGNSIIIQAFTVVIVGGLGSIRGAFIASLVLGFAESIGSLYFPSMAFYIAIILILLVRPQGIIQTGVILASAPQGGFFDWLSKKSDRKPLDRAAAAIHAIQPGAGARLDIGRSTTSLAFGVLIAAVAVTVPWWANDGLMFIAGFVLVEALFALSWNLLFGYAGLAVFGHAAFFGIGAYLLAFFLKEHTGVPFFLGLAGAGVAGMLIAVLVGFLALRRSGVLQLAILTLALAEILRILVSYSGALGYDEGIGAIPRPVIDFGLFELSLRSNVAYYWFLCFAFAVLATAMWLITHNSFGRTLRSIHQDPERAAFIGVNINRYRLMAFVAASGLAAVIGGLAAPLTQIVTPESMGVAKSAAPMLNSLLGGSSMFWGPAVGALAFSMVEYSTRTLAGMSEFITGVILLFIVLLAPSGLLGLLSEAGRRIAAMVSRR